MTTCTFIGHHSILDHDLPDRILDVLERVLDMDNEFVFLFYERRKFLLEVWNALELVKRGYPNKQICVTFVGREYPAQEIMRAHYFDKIVHPLSPYDGNHLIQLRAYIRWCVNHSDYVVSYLYDLLYDDKKWALHYTLKNKAVKVIDITSDFTRTELFDEMKRLHGRQRTILEFINEGKSYREIAGEWNCKLQNVRQVYFVSTAILIGLHQSRFKARQLPGPYHGTMKQIKKITVL